MSSQPPCPDCEALRAQLAAARAGRDEALLAVAREREKVNALRQALPHVIEAPAPNYPGSVAPGEPPLRYVMADAANTAIKRYLGPLQEGGRQAAKLALRILGGKGGP
jgi:hypothetical protein